MEAAAADSVARDLSIEPTRSVLHRSVASLAMQLGDFNTATRYVEDGLRGHVPDEIREELAILLDQIMTAEALRKSYHRAPVGLTHVQKVIRRFTNKAPINIVGLARALGVTVRQSDMGLDSGEISRDLARGGFSGYCIVVNSAHSKVRKRFTVAHELGHFLRHRNRISNRLVDDTMYRSALGTTKETEANQLAADLLMPRRLIAELRLAGIKTVEELASRFEVSVEAMKNRLGRHKQ
jgi:Zn-dependent peptidase ImmA (M78 family)